MKLSRYIALVLAAISLIEPQVAWAQTSEPGPTIVTYEDDIRKLIKRRCVKCHNLDRDEARLDLSSYNGIMAGSYSGDIVVQGTPDDSLLYLTTHHLEEPFMPPKTARMPQRELDALALWIQLGMPENASSSVLTPPLESIQPHPISATFTETSTKENSEEISRLDDEYRPPNSITALASHPSTGTLAIGSQREVILTDLATDAQIQSIPFPEGEIFDLKFSREGQFLIIAGGTHVETGTVVLWDIRKQQRFAQIGDEYDIVLAADMTNNRELVALGGPDRLVKGYRRDNGELVYRGKKHTDWVTQIAFSPDGLLLASGDRAGNLFVWEAKTGASFATLRGHKASITGLAWSDDSEALISVSEDGNAIRWDLHQQAAIQQWALHSRGVLSLARFSSGQFVTSGRDKTVKRWSPEFAFIDEITTTALPTQVVFGNSATSIAIGDWRGRVFQWQPGLSSELQSLSLKRSWTPPSQSIMASAETVPIREKESNPSLDDVFSEFETVLDNLNQTRAELASALEKRHRLTSIGQQIATLETSQSRQKEHHQQLLTHLELALLLANKPSVREATPSVSVLIELAEETIEAAADSQEESKALEQLLEERSTLNQDLANLEATLTQLKSDSETAEDLARTLSELMSSPQITADQYTLDPTSATMTANE